jgi:hypothetical protein
VRREREKRVGDKSSKEEEEKNTKRMTGKNEDEKVRAKI